jgi:prevent-host-death family protein
MTMGARWQLQQAKNHFSEVVEGAIKEGPQTVTKHGKDAVVVVSADQFRGASVTGSTQRQSLAEFLLQSPLRGTRLRIRRSRDTGRLRKLGQ